MGMAGPPLVEAAMDEDAEAVAAQIRLAVGSPIQLYIEAGSTKDPGPWQVSPDFIAGMISVIRVDDKDSKTGSAHYEVKANVEPLRTFLGGLAPQLTVDPVNARFLFDENAKQLQVISDSVDGRAMDVDATLKALQDSIFKKDNRRVGHCRCARLPSCRRCNDCADKSSAFPGRSESSAGWVPLRHQRG